MAQCWFDQSNCQALTSSNQFKRDSRSIKCSHKFNFSSPIHHSLSRLFQPHSRALRMSVTPKSEKTVSLTSGQENAQPAPTPKQEFKKPPPVSTFMSPTDIMVSPCTQKLMHTRRWMRNGRPKVPFHSKLADKENVHKAAPKTATVSQETKPQESV